MSKKFYYAAGSGIQGIGAVFQKTILLITAIFLFSCSSEQNVSYDHLYTVSPPAGTYAETSAPGVNLDFTYDIKYNGETAPFTVENESLPAGLTLSQNGDTVTISSDSSISGDYTVSYDIVVSDNGFPYVRYTYVYNITYASEEPKEPEEPADDPYHIYTEEQLRNVKNDLGGHYFLMNNIWLKNGDWEPIGDNNDPFTGKFEGNGYKISDVEIRINDDYHGFFGYISCAVINNLGVFGNIDGRNFVGGIVGYNEGGEIANSYFMGKVGGSRAVGGIAGMNEGTITNSYTTPHSYSTGSVVGREAAGGIAGVNEGTITNCYSTSNLTTYGQWIGGIAGRNEGGTITNCYSTGIVNAQFRVGGIAGYNEDGTITNCYSTGSVTAYGENAGGIVGDNIGGTITNCYSTGSVTVSEQRAGGIVGDDEGGTITNNAALMENINAYETDYRRIVGANNRSDTISDNYAFSGMKFNDADTSWSDDTTLDGIDVDKGTGTTDAGAPQISNPDFWSGTLGFSGEIWDLDFDRRTNGYLLPMLIGMTPGDPGMPRRPDIPEHPGMPEHLNPNP